MRKIKVAFIDYVLEPDKPGKSGLSDLVWDMASELVNQGHEAHIIASYYTHQYPDDRVIVHNFPTPPIGYRNIIGQLWILKRAEAIAKRIKPDIIHAPEYISTAIFAVLGSRAPLVLTVPGNVYQRLSAGQPDEGLYFMFLKWAARVSARHCAKIIAISSEMKHWWEWTGSDPRKTPFIPLGVNNHLFHFVPDAKKILGLSDDKFVFLYTGRFSIEKGLLDVIEAVNQIKLEARQSSLKIIFIGSGGLLPKMESEIAGKNIGDFFEIKSWISKEDLSTWYSAADALLLPSYAEGLSRTILEAMICGTPVIGSRITGTEDMVIEGVNGYLFTPHHVNEIGSILKKIIQKDIDLHSLRPATLDYAQNNLTWPIIVNRIINEVYLPILDRK